MCIYSFSLNHIYSYLCVVNGGRFVYQQIQNARAFENKLWKYVQSNYSSSPNELFTTYVDSFSGIALPECYAFDRCARAVKPRWLPRIEKGNVDCLKSFNIHAHKWRNQCLCHICTL